MVDTQWNIWYWGSKWNLHTVCWDAVGCEWGTASVYFGITYVCFIPSRLPVFAAGPQYRLQDFLFLSKVSFEGHIQNLQKISCWFKIWIGFVGPILIKLWTSSIWGFLWLSVWWPLGGYLCKHAGDHSVTTEVWTSPHLTCLGLCGMAAWKLSAPWLRVTGLCAGNSPGTGEFPAQMASNARNVSIWWRLHATAQLWMWQHT